MPTQENGHLYRESLPIEIINSSLSQDEFGICVRTVEGRVVFQNEQCIALCTHQIDQCCENCTPDGARTALSFSRETNINSHVVDAVTLNSPNHRTKLFTLSETTSAQTLIALKSCGLTQAEFNIAKLVLQKKSNKDILKKLNIQLSTLKTHLNHLYQKAPFLKKYRD